MGKRLLRAIPTWQLEVLVEAQQGRYGEDGVRITQLFGLISVILESHVQSGAPPGDVQIPEMLRQAAVKSFELRAAVQELRELLQKHGQSNTPGSSLRSEHDPLRLGGIPQDQQPGLPLRPAGRYSTTWLAGPDP